MEFFEKAHISKNNDSKSRKTTENVKKQLKQMLHGYKNSDNKLIQSSANSKDEFDDSTSVSGFSDLNLTVSSHDDDMSRQSIPTNEESIEITDESESVSPTNTISDDNNTEDFNVDSLPEKNYLDTKSEDSGSVSLEDLESISKKNIEQDEVCSGKSEISSSNELGESDKSSLSESEISVVSEMLDSLPESDKSDVFDLDGTLAATIIKNLKLNNSKTKNNKRKHIEDIGGSNLKKGPNHKMSQKSKKLKPLQTLPIESATSPCTCDYDENIDNHVSTIISPQSVKAENLKYQTFSEVMSDYKHPTFRKSYLGYHNLITSTRSSDAFSHVPMNAKFQTVLPVMENLPNEMVFSQNTQSDFQNCTTTIPPVELDEVCDVIPEINEVNSKKEITAGISEINKPAETNIDGTLDTLENTLEPEVISDSELSIAEEADYINAAETFKLYYGHNCCIIVLKHPAELYLKGKVSVKALGGTVEVCGYILNGELCNIYAPYYSYAHCIRTVQNENLYYGLFGILTSAGLTVAEAETIVTSAGDQDGVILLQSLKDLSMEYVDSSFKRTNLFVKPQKNIDPYFIKASDMLNCSLSSMRPFKRFITNPSWKEANEHAQKNMSIGIVCGGKGTGKSTYVRYQVNKLITKGPVVVIDLDIGQSEFSAAGSISGTIVRTPLLGPNYTHLTNSEILLNIGIINPMENLSRYLNTVYTLLDHCRNKSDFANKPWIINTMGITNELGLKILTYLIILVHPTYLVQYESKNRKRRFDQFFRPTVVKLMYLDYKNDLSLPEIPHPRNLNYAFILANELERPAKIKQSLRPKEERYLNFLAYFSQLINVKNTSLLSIRPYKVHCLHLHIASNVTINSNLIWKVINGKIVGLCKYSSEEEVTPPQANKLTVSFMGMQCFGHGLVRGIDFMKQMLYVITPVPDCVLSEVDTLLYADWVPELEGLENHLPINTFVPYRTTTQEQNKQLMSTSHRRFNPLQLLKMTRSS